MNPGSVIPAWARCPGAGRAGVGGHPPTGTAVGQRGSGSSSGCCHGVWLEEVISAIRPSQQRQKAGLDAPMLRSSSWGSMRREQSSSHPVPTSPLTPLMLPCVWQCSLPRPVSNAMVWSCHAPSKRHLAERDCARSCPSPAGRGVSQDGVLDTETHRGIQGQEVPIHGDLLPGSTTGTLPTPLLGFLGPQALQAQPALSAPGTGGWKLGSKPQTAKRTLSQEKANRGHDTRIYLSRAAHPRWIPKEPRQGRACFPTVFATAEPPAHP